MPILPARRRHKDRSERWQGIVQNTRKPTQAMTMDTVQVLPKLGFVRKLWDEIVDPNILCITTSANRAIFRIRVIPLDGSAATDRNSYLTKCRLCNSQVNFDICMRLPNTRQIKGARLTAVPHFSKKDGLRTLCSNIIR
jgi:hypothetical protein